MKEKWKKEKQDLEKWEKPKKKLKK
jgi:hypothetical protein